MVGTANHKTTHVVSSSSSSRGLRAASPVHNSTTTTGSLFFLKSQLTMTGCGEGGGPPPSNGGEFLLQLLQKPHQQPNHISPHHLDPAVASMGPTFPSNGHQQSPLPSWMFPPTSNNNTPWGVPGLPPPPNLPHPHPPLFADDFQRLGLLGGTSSSNGRPHTLTPQRQEEQKNRNLMMFGSLPPFDQATPEPQLRFHKPVGAPPGFPQRPKGNVDSRLGLSGRIDHPVGTKLRSLPALDIEESLATLHMQAVEEDRRRDEANHHVRGAHWEGDLSEQLINSVRISNGLETNVRRQSGANPHDKVFRSNISRELQLPGQRMRNHRRAVDCRSDIDRMNVPFLAIFESLVPAEEEKAKQKQLLTSLEKLVNKEWPRAQLYLYGSCANSFGVSKSDIDVCLAIEDVDINKSELLLKLADILQEENFQNVQALTRARVPIVKLMDPVTGISCDICVNNVLAVVNTKLLRDYAQIDGRLRQLAFIVKHWAKTRGVNVTYKGTLSSYAYVLMCIHFLQQRKPAILPCLQGMEANYVVNVDDIECAYFDQVQNLRDYGARNKETIAQLVWAFFDYWAYRHDYANAVISVRTGSIISKRAKDWTRRIGNDRHLICIEDPFEVSHDLGRVVDKYSIKILREEFERAANILQFDPDPCVTLFKPYVPPNHVPPT